jgi:hypothetical protein
MVYPLRSAEIALAEFFRLWSDRRQANSDGPAFHRTFAIRAERVLPLGLANVNVH